VKTIKKLAIVSNETTCCTILYLEVKGNKS
jgi:hypothetical protein